MQSLSQQSFERTFFWSIDFVSDQRMSNACHVDTDLMGSSGLKFTLDIGIISEALQNFVVCNGFPSVFTVRAHLLTVCRMTADRCVDCAGIFFDIAMYDRNIDTADRMHF